MPSCSADIRGDTRSKGLTPRPRGSPLEDGGSGRLVCLLGRQLALHALDLLVQRGDARFELTDRKALEVFTQRDALGRLRLQIVPVHGLLPVWPNRDAGSHSNWKTRRSNLAMISLRCDQPAVIDLVVGEII